MINVFRRNQRVLMLVIAILTIVAFAFLYNPAKISKLGTNSVARIYGKDLTQADIDRLVRNYQLALAMGQYELLNDLGGMDSDDRRSLEDFVWNIQIAKHESEALALRPTDEQVAELMKGLPAFQTDGHYDSSKFAAFSDTQLGPRGLTQDDLEQTARDALKVIQLKKIIVSPVVVSDGEVDEAMRIFQKIDLQVVHFPLPDITKIEVSDADVTKYFDDNKAALLAPETRAVEYVEFALTPAQTGLAGKEKVDAMQKLADTASAFAEKAENSPTLADAAKGGTVEVHQTADFDRNGTASATAPNGVAPSEQQDFLKGIAPSAFLLNDKNTVSDVIQEGDKFAVIRLIKTTPQRPLTLAEAKPGIEATLRSEKLQSEARTQAEASAAKLREQISAGHSLAEAAAPLGLTVDSETGLVPSNLQPTSPVSMEAVRASLLMQPAQLSGLVPTQAGYAAVFVVSRAPLDTTGADFAKQKDAAKQQLLTGKRDLLFATWLAAQREVAGIAAVSHR